MSSSEMPASSSDDSFNNKNQTIFKRADSNSAVFFDTDANIDEDANFDYFDTMEVLYFENLMHQKMPPLAKLKKGIREKVEDKQQRLRQKALQQRAQLERSIHKRKKKIRETMSKPGFVLTIDKVSFVGGILIIMVTEFVLLMAPEKMGLLYSVLLFPLMLLRYLVYRMDKMHYFMYDFCYFIQILMLLNLHRYPESEVFLKINFSLTNGPLAVAVIMWRNSLVFHSVDKMTSSFIHMLPPLVTFCMRWQQELLERKFPMWTTTREEPILTLLVDFYLYPFGLYVLWQALYLFKTEIYSKRKLLYNTELMTSLRWLTKNPKSASYKIINRFGEQHQLAAFVVYQGIYTIVTVLGIPLLWHSMQLHALFLAIIFIVALMNGAAYYFHVFAVRYIDKIGKGNNNAKQDGENKKQESNNGMSETSFGHSSSEPRDGGDEKES